jgi:hypothetical protein
MSLPARRRSQWFVIADRRGDGFAAAGSTFRVRTNVFLNTWSGGEIA